MHYLLTYDFAPDYMQRRAQFRAAHLVLAWQAVERGELLLAGLLEEPISAVLLFQAESAEVPAAYAAADPYVLNGLVTKWQVRVWHTAVGKGATNPVHVA